MWKRWTTEWRCNHIILQRLQSSQKVVLKLKSDYRLWRRQAWQHRDRSPTTVHSTETRITATQKTKWPSNPWNTQQWCRHHPISLCQSPTIFSDQLAPSCRSREQADSVIKNRPPKKTKSFIMNQNITENQKQIKHSQQIPWKCERFIKLSRVHFVLAWSIQC